MAAGEDIIKMRKLVMDGNGQAAKVSVGMIKGDIPFDAAVAAAVVHQIGNGAEIFPALFPAGTETGDTKAGEAIWTDMAGFQAAAAATVAAAKAASEAAAQGQEAFGKAFMALGATCQGCHEKYRKS